MTCQSSALDTTEASWDHPVLTLYVVLVPFRAEKRKMGPQGWDLVML